MQLHGSARWTRTLIALLLCGCGSRDAAWESVAAGQSKEEVLAVLGEPDREETMFKRGEPVFGPPEEFWHELESGDALEIWTYEFPGSGSFQVYYLKGAGIVGHVAFMEEGLVF